MGHVRIFLQHKWEHVGYTREVIETLCVFGFTWDNKYTTAAYCNTLLVKIRLENI